MFLISVAAATAMVFSLIIYRLYFHALAKYPGPLLGRITDWYSVYHWVKGDRHLDFVHLHAKYGDVVRYGPNRLSFSTIEALQAIYGSRANTKKSFWYDVMTYYMKIPSTHATTNKAEHSRKRRILSQALSDRMMPVYEEGFLKILDDFTKRIERSSSMNDLKSPTLFDAQHEFTLLNFDSMGEFCFGESFGSIQDPKKAIIVEKSHEAFRGLGAIGHMPGLSWLKLEHLSNTASLMAEYQAYAAALARKCIRRIDEKSVESRNRRCVFDILYSSSDRSHASVPELQSESSLLVTTGTDTTAGALSNLMFHILNNEECMEKLKQEVRGSFSDISDIRMGKTLNNCSYFAACIDESLRLTSVVGGCLLREVLPGGMNIDGQHITEGVDVGVPFHVIMRNESYFERPWEYRPQRWIFPDTPKEQIERSRAAYCPFGIGNTGCVGRKWALIEMQLTLARLVFRYDIEMVLTEHEKSLAATERLKLREQASLDWFVLSNEGPFLRFHEAATLAASS